MKNEDRKKLVQMLKKEGRIIQKNVEKAFLEIPRDAFIPEHLKKHAYVDTPLQIGQRQTISAPHMVAIMVEALDIKIGQKILEIGTGSGYHAAIVSKLIGEKGHIYTIERHKQLVETSKQNLNRIGIKNITVTHGDGSEGLSKHAPFDIIYVTCAAPILPHPLIDQLKEKGKLLIPIGKTI